MEFLPVPAQEQMAYDHPSLHQPGVGIHDRIQDLAGHFAMAAQAISK
ncbi:MAG: hypothetical protein ACLVGL_14620 [Waltera sp.]